MRLATRLAGLLAPAALAGVLLMQVAAAADDRPLRVIASSVPHAEILAFVQTRLAPDFKLQVTEITGEINPNEVLAHGDVDANFFQHEPFLRTEEKALGRTFAIAAITHVEPLGIYSRIIRSFADVPEGATVSVPNNTSNLSRALRLLEANGLIKLKPALSASAAQLATSADIAENPKKLKILEIDGRLLPSSLGDVALAVINGNYALQAGLVPAKDALALEKAQGNPYANILVTTPGLAADPRILRLARLLQSHEVATFIGDRYRGSVIPVNP